MYLFLPPPPPFGVLLLWQEESSMPHGNLGAAPRCLPEEEYPEGGRWWEK